MLIYLLLFMTKFRKKLYLYHCLQIETYLSIYYLYFKINSHSHYLYFINNSIVAAQVYSRNKELIKETFEKPCSKLVQTRWLYKYFLYLKKKKIIKNIANEILTSEYLWMMTNRIRFWNFWHQSLRLKYSEK